MAPLFGILSTLLLSSSPTPNPQQPQQLLEVCLSPGCIADGAQETLSRLRAFAPPDTQILPGKCASACGAGPVVLKGVVEDVDEKRIVCKRIAGEALLNLLRGSEEEEEGGYIVPDEIIRGYEAMMLADGCMSRKEYDKAAEKYHDAIELALPTAMKLHGLEKKESATTSPPRGLEWIIKTHRQEAQARIQLRQPQKALELSQTGWELSQQTDQRCLECIIQSCCDLGDVKGELEALRMLLVEMEPEEDASREVLNRRREFGFRLAKLEREASS